MYEDRKGLNTLQEINRRLVYKITFIVRIVQQD